MRTQRRILLAATLATALAAGPSQAQETDEFEGDPNPVRSYQPNAPVGPSTWYDVTLAPRGDHAPFAAATRADREFVDGMRNHHQGAVTMSQEYLADPTAISPPLKSLAYAIIVNQRAEILLMDDVARRIAEPVRTVDLGLFRLALRSMATENIYQDRMIQPVPVPGPLNAGGAVNRRDVQFAKAMSTHHSAALDMARGYQRNPEARNGYLGYLTVQIVTEQTQEIALMQRLIQSYPGDLAAVQVPPGMMHGMEMSGSGGHGGQPAEGGGHRGH